MKGKGLLEDQYQRTGFEHVCNDTDRRNNLKQYCTCKYCTLYIIISLYLDYTNIMHIK